MFVTSQVKPLKENVPTAVITANSVIPVVRKSKLSTQIVAPIVTLSEPEVAVKVEKKRKTSSTIVVPVGNAKSASVEVHPEKKTPIAKVARTRKQTAE